MNATTFTVGSYLHNHKGTTNHEFITYQITFRSFCTTLMKYMLMVYNKKYIYIASVRF